MGLFSKARTRENEMSRHYLAEAPLGPRTDNLAGACVAQLRDSPLASAAIYGEPVTTAALEPAIEHVRYVMRQDRDLSAWIARKSLYILAKIPEIGGSVTDPQGWPEPAFAAMGLKSAGPAQAQLTLGAGEDLSETDRASVVRLGSMARWVLSAATYGQASWLPSVRAPLEDLYTGASGEDVESKAYAITAWTSVATGRLLNSGRAHHPVFRLWGEVPVMSEGGCYPNPAKNGDVSAGDAQFQRYWDGSAWTDRVRVRQGNGGWNSFTSSLHASPDD